VLEMAEDEKFLFDLPGSWSKSQRWMMDVLRPNVPWRSRRGGDVPLVHDER
jgi:hypothetical protein